jgi:hypothetical protein
MKSSQYHDSPHLQFSEAISTNSSSYYFPTISSAIQNAPPLHKTIICVHVSYSSCGLHVQHFITSAMLCGTYTFNIVSLICVNDQQEATVQDNLLFLGCSTSFERYFRSSLGASKLYYIFWYYTRMLLPAGIMGVLQCSNTPMLPAGTDIRV